MLMIPLPFVIALAVAGFALSELFARGMARRAGWLLAFLAVLFFQEVLVGLRFGYGMEGLRTVQPLSAACLAPLAYLSFKRPEVTASVALHLLPLAAVVLTVVVWGDALDVVLALTNLIYAGLLIRLGLGGSDALDWVEVNRARIAMFLLWAVTAVLLISCVTDAAIAYDFWLTQGSNTGRIAGWITALAVVGFCIGITLVAYLSRVRRSDVAGQAGQAPQDSAQNADAFAALETLMQTEQLHLDPDINLSRIARRMRRPAREVSRAVNVHARCNVSHYINGLRVAEACRLLADTDMAVTQVIYAAGFNTKSNFNRAFARVTGQTPSAWRDGQRG